MGRVILDTGVLVATARGQLEFSSAVAPDEDAALPAVVLAEYLLGIELSDDPAHKAAQRAFLDELLTLAPVEDYTPDVAGHHAALMLHTRREGKPRGAHDLMIAATARATGRTLVTTDARADFENLPDVDARVLAL